MQEWDCEMKFWKGYRDHSKHRFEELIMFAVDPAKKQTVGGEIQELNSSGKFTKCLMNRRFPYV